MIKNPIKITLKIKAIKIPAVALNSASNTKLPKINLIKDSYDCEKRSTAIIKRLD